MPIHNTGDFGAIDLLEVLSFIAQLENIESDKKQNSYIHGVIETIGHEIENLHKENEIIMDSITELRELLIRVLNLKNF